MNKKNLCLGFTLAETMIAMAVVGVIAALTIPNVIANYQRQTYVTQLQKNVNDLEQNLTILQGENYTRSGIHSTVLGVITRVARPSASLIEGSSGVFLRGNANNKPYYDVMKDCGTTAQPCFADTYRSINGDNSEQFNCNGYTITAKNGAAICIRPAVTMINLRPNRPNRPIDISLVRNPAVVFIDINGPEDPNIGGRDLFTFNIYEDFTISEVNPNLSEAEKNNNITELSAGCLTSPNGTGCFTRITEDNWKMNY